MTLDNCERGIYFQNWHFTTKNAQETHEVDLKLHQCLSNDVFENSKVFWRRTPRTLNAPEKFIEDEDLL